jgi:hypothetical protein
MRNPWTSKNPFMSMWLSSANKMMNTARGQATAAVKREASTQQAQGLKQITDFWTGKAAVSAPAARKRKKKL